MTDEVLFEKVRSILAEVAEIDGRRITLQSSPADIEEWDSLAQVNLVLSLEQEFGLQFSPAQIEEMAAGVGKIVETLRTRTK